MIGFGLAAAIARAIGADGPDTVSLIILAGGTAALGGALVGLVGRALATRPLRTQLAAVAIGSLVGVGMGALVGARAMFLSQHDTGAITVLLVAAGTVGVLAALTLTDRLDRSLADLGTLVQQIDVRNDEPASPPDRMSGPPELTNLAGELHEVRARLDEANRRQRALETSRGELITWVSHDLREPLARIRHLAGALDERVHPNGSSESGRHQVQPESDVSTSRHHQLRCEVDRLAAIVDDLLELSSRDLAGSAGSAPVVNATSESAAPSAPRTDDLFDLAFAEPVNGRDNRSGVIHT